MFISGKILDQLDLKIITKLNEIIPRLALKDSTIWGAQSEAHQRLGWLDSPRLSRQLLPELDAITAWARAHRYESFILCGMGGSSLAPEVITAASGKALTVLDSTSPDQIWKATPKQLEKTLMIFASKSGTTIETLSHLKYFKDLISKRGLDPKEHILIITDPNTDLDKEHRKLGYRVFNGDPLVGGRFSALTTFGLLPSALVGCDTSLLLDDAESASKTLLKDNSPAVLIAAAFYSKSEQIINFMDSKSSTPGLSNWIEQLIAESTGKNGKGRLPVLSNKVQSGEKNLSVGFEDGNFDLIVKASLGEHFILWEVVTSLLCFLLSVDPFAQPDVANAKEKTSEILSSSTIKSTFDLIIDNKDCLITSNQSIRSVAEFLNLKPAYFAILAYLPKDIKYDGAQLQELINLRSNTATTFGWGPRYLHSTGQIHKGGQPNGAFIQITHQIESDLGIPDEKFTFGDLFSAQAHADAQSLSELGLPVIQIHLKNTKANLLDLFN